MPFALGMPALIEIPALNDLIDLCQELELSFIELNMNMPENCPEELDPLEVRDASEATASSSRCIPPTNWTSVRCTPLYAKGICSHEEVLGWSAQAGIKVLNMHLSPAYTSRCRTEGVDI